MPTFDAESADCQVFTFKEGLLSAVAHDLELRVDSFEIAVADDRASVHARFEPASIRVVEAVVDGRPSPGTLGAKDKAKIESNLRGEVLDAKRYPTIRFESREIREVGAGWEVKGTLQLAGRSREIMVPVHKDGDRAVGEYTLHQPDFGIKPFSAMLGTLKIQPDVRVRVSIPLTE